MFGMITLFQTAWQRHRILLLSLAAGLFTFQLLIAGIYGTTVRRSLSQNFARNQTFYIRIRGAIGSVDIFTPEGWLGFGYAHPLTLVMVIAWTIAVASAAAAREIEYGTAEFLVSRPVDRRVILAARLLAWAAGLAIVLGSGYLGTLTGTCLVNDLSAFDRIAGLRLPAALVPVLVALAGVAFLGSAVSSSRGRANAVAIAFAVASYFLNFAAFMWEPLGSLAPLSIFHYLTPAEWMRNGIAWDSVAIPTLFGAVLLLGAHETFHRRDIAP